MAQPPEYQLGPLHVVGAPPIDAALVAAHAATATGGARVMDISADGTHVLALAGGELIELPERRVVVSDVAISWARYGPAGAIAWTADARGDERYALMVDGHERVAAPVFEPVWRDRLAAARATGAEMALWVDGATTPLASGLWLPVDLSRDGRFALVREERSSAEQVLYRVELATGQRFALTPDRAAAPAAAFARDGSVVAISDAGRDRRALVAIDGRGTRSLVADASADVTAFALGPAGGLAYALTDDAGMSTLVVDGRPIARGVIGDLRFAAGAPVLAFTHDRGAVSYDLRSERTTTWIAGPTGGPAWAHVTIAPAIHTLVLRPAIAQRAPVVLELHGGPEDRWLPRHDGFAQWLASRGFAVVRPDVRGSAGHGRAFAMQDDGARRDDVLRDIAAVLRWIAQQPELDAAHVIVVGTSYGGYLALRALAAFPDRLRAAATLGAVTDLAGFLAGTSPERRAHRAAEYGHDPALLARLSADPRQLRGTILIAHGARDTRVPVATAERFIAAARAAGVAVWSLIADDEGHVFEHADTRAAFDVLLVQLGAGTLRARVGNACCSTPPSSRATRSQQRAPSR